MMKILNGLLAVISAGFVYGCGCIQPQVPCLPSGITMPGINQEMNTPDFWIKKYASPDTVILDPEGIQKFNRDSEQKHLIKDLIVQEHVILGTEVREEVLKEIHALKVKKLYDARAKIVGEDFYRRIEACADLGSVPSQVSPRYGFVFRYADQRLIPTDEIITSEPGDVEFDEIQNSSLDIGIPVQILHESKNGSWVYTWSSSSAGWVKKENIVFCSFEEFKRFVSPDSFAVVINAKAEIFRDPSLSRPYAKVRMGAFFPSVGSGHSMIRILIPAQGKDGGCHPETAYVKKEDVHIGFLAFTPRIIIRQAFKLLNAPYGWGGMNGEQDCSGFIQEIFAAVGIRMPRNSSEQGLTGNLKGEFKGRSENQAKLNILRSVGDKEIAVLRLKGHIILFLGTHKGTPYAIHALYGYKEKTPRGFITRKVNKVVVSDLFLGEGSEKGSLLDRIIMICSIGKSTQ
ncbi:MAG: SH3 domain-containing protein [Candidatus Omnitrophica bacterium]|nr:SH3 domain-containing protein [Candidatus Omnitrophota bacterium]